MKNKICSLLLVFAFLFASIVPLTVTAEEGASEGVTETPLTAVIAPVKDDRTAMVTMTFDDGDYDTAVWLTEEFTAYDLKGSCMLIVKSNLDGDTYKENNAAAAKWAALFATGRVEPQSHTMTHTVIPSESWAEGNQPSSLYNANQPRYKYELIDSKALLEQYFPDQYIIAMASSNNTLSSYSFKTDDTGALVKENDEYVKVEDGGAFAVASKNYYAIRNGARGIQSTDPTLETDGTSGSWSSLYMRRFSDASGSTDEAKVASAKAWLDSAISQKGWLVTLCHGITETGGDFNKPKADAFFAYVGQKVADGTVWCASFSEAVRYLREKQNSTVSASLVGDTVKVKVTMADTTGDGHDLPASIFNYPLTVKVEVPADVQAVKYVNSEDKTVVTSAYTESGKNYVKIDAVPNGDEVSATSVLLKKSKSGIDSKITVCSDGDNVENAILASAKSNGYNPAICRKAYMKLSLANIDTSATKSAYVILNVTKAASANLSVWAISDASWDPAALTAENAPANDLTGDGLLSSGVVGGQAIATFPATAGQHTIDVTSVALAAKQSGAEEITLAVTVNKTAEPVDVTFTIETPEKVPVYVYSTDCDSNIGLIGAGAEADSPQTIDATDNHTGNAGGKALHITTTKNYQRPFLKSILNESNTLTADMIGSEYVVTFWYKASSAGKYTVRMADGLKRPSSGAHGVTVTVAAADVGKWVQYTYSFTVDQAQIDAIGTHISFQMTGFGQSQANPVQLYIDDITSVRYGGSDAVALAVTNYATVGAEDNLVPGILYNSNAAPLGLKYGFASATIPDGITNATLALSLNGAADTTVDVYGIVGATFASSVSFDRAPGILPSGDVDIGKAFGRLPLATIAGNDPGTPVIDITAYAQATKGQLLFLFASSDASEPISIDVSTVTYTEGVEGNGFAFTFIDGDTTTVLHGFQPTFPEGPRAWIGSDGNLYAANDPLPESDLTLTAPHIEQKVGAALSLSESVLYFGATVDENTKALLADPVIGAKLKVSISAKGKSIAVTDEGDLYTVALPFTDPTASMSVVVNLVWGDEETVVAVAAKNAEDHFRTPADVAAAALADLRDTADETYRFPVGDKFSKYGSIDRDYLATFVNQEGN